MSLAILKSIVSENNGRLFDYGLDGLLILDRTGKRITHICRNNTGDIDAVSLDTVHSFFADAQESSEAEQVPKVRIDSNVAVLSHVESCDAFFSAVKEFHETHEVTLRFHSENPLSNWSDVLNQRIELLKNRRKEKQLFLQIYSPYERMTESDKDFLFNQDFQLLFVHDSITFSSSIRDTLLDLAEYGFRVPFVWYIHEQNVKQIPEMIDEAMVLNHNAGFSVPLISECFYKKTLLSPSSGEYLRLLVDIYSKYPFYDEVLYPLNTALEASLFKSFNTKSLIYRWDECTFTLLEVLVPFEVGQAHEFLLRSFLWQRWLVFNAYQDVSSCDCRPNT